MNRWTPAKGAATLLREFEADFAHVCLASLVSGEVSSTEFVHEPWSTVLAHIGNYRRPPNVERNRAGRADGTPLDLSRQGNSYWARSWAARALAYIGNERTS